MSKQSSKKAIKAVLFDLGKVILFFNFDPAFQKLSKTCGIPRKEFEDYFISSGLEVLYDGGKITSFEFYSEIKRSLKLKISFAKFKSIWNAIFTPNKPMIRLIQKLSKKYRLVLVSNTNAMHFEYIRKKYAFIKIFDHIVLSYKEKIRKPDEKIYRISAKACRATPQEILYIDDRADLTGAAQELGFHTFTYKNNFTELLKTLEEKGIHAA